jgi:hypothetical protein
MNIQEYVNNEMKKARDKQMLTSDQLTLGEILGKLKPILEKQKERENESTVKYDFEYLFPTGIDSWRGSYSEIALDFSDYDYTKNKKPMTVSEFYKLIESAIGETFEGYKGGDFTMTENTPVWVANYGNSGNTAVIDIVDAGYEVIIITGYRPY